MRSNWELSVSSSLRTSSVPDTSLSLPSLLSTRSNTLSSCSLPDSSPRPNEHLAVLLAKELWKPDSSALNCDNFYCRARFSLVQRRHHCRKCGGVFCNRCSARTTSLLDLSALPFMHPPRGTPITAFDSPMSPTVTARVCNDCHDYIHGVRWPHLFTAPRPAPPSRANSNLPSPMALLCDHISQSTLSSPMSSHSDPTAAPLQHPTILPNCHFTRTQSRTRRFSPVSVHTVPSSADKDTLDAYPLRFPSLVSKVIRNPPWQWQPKVEDPDPGQRVLVIGGKAPFEIEMEQEEEEERRRRENPVIHDGGSCSAVVLQFI